MNNGEMLSLLDKASWIYGNKNPQEDEYASYFGKMELYNNETPDSIPYTKRLICAVL